MFSRKFFHMRISLGALLLLFTIIYRIRNVNANPLQVSDISRRDDGDSDSYPDDDEIRDKLEVEEDKSVFFLSCTQEALNFAQKYNRTTYREALSPFFTKLRNGDADQYKDFLVRVSRIFAESSSGTAYVLLPASKKAKDCSIWSSIQLPELTKKGSKVEKILQVECDDFEKVKKLWPREKEESSEDEESGSEDNKSGSDNDKSGSDDQSSGSDSDSSDSDGGGSGGIKGPNIDIDPIDIGGGVGSRPKPGSGPKPGSRPKPGPKPGSKPGKEKESDDKKPKDKNSSDTEKDSSDADESSSDTDESSSDSDENSSDEGYCLRDEKEEDQRLLQKRDGGDDICFEPWIFDEQWRFTFYLNERCSGATTGMAGNGPTACQTGLLNGYADAYIVSILTDKCKITYFSDDSCKEKITTSKEDTDKCTPSDEAIGSWLVTC